MVNNFRIIFIHGYTASSNSDWYPDLTPMLDKYNIDYSIPDLPGGYNPHANEWLNVIHHEALKNTKPLILVGHSLGSRAVLLYLENFQRKVSNVFLIAAFANDIENANRTSTERESGNYRDFFDHEINLKIIKPLVKKFFVIHSKDDSSIPFDQGIKIAEDLNAKLITFKNLDHLSRPECAPYIFKVLKKELKFKM